MHSSMAAIRTTATFFFCREMKMKMMTMIRSSSTSLTFISRRTISYTPLRCDSGGGGGGGSGGGGRNQASAARMSLVQQLLHDAMERSADRHEPIPKITLDHVNVSFARSGGPGGQNVNKVNTKVHMRFNIKEAYWLSERVKEKILQMEKKRINKDGELVISSTKTRTQKGNIQDALQKVQEIIDAACYVPPPPSEEQIKKITKLAAISESRRMHGKKVLSQKKAFRRSSRGR